MAVFVFSSPFKLWFKGLKDARAKARILSRIDLAELGNFGDCAPVGEGISEMRIHYGPGFRLYYSRQDEIVYLLLLGGDKRTQKRDIERAIDMMRDIRKATK
jgi:putative addiction module killer protein